MTKLKMQSCFWLLFGSLILQSVLAIPTTNLPNFQEEEDPLPTTIEYEIVNVTEKSTVKNSSEGSNSKRDGRFLDLALPALIDVLIDPLRPPCQEGRWVWREGYWSHGHWHPRQWVWQPGFCYHNQFRRRVGQSQKKRPQKKPEQPKKKKRRGHKGGYHRRGHQG